MQKIITVELLNKILAYLSRCPYADVYQVIAELMELPEVTDKPIEK